MTQVGEVRTACGITRSAVCYHDVLLFEVAAILRHAFSEPRQLSQPAQKHDVIRHAPAREHQSLVVRRPRELENLPIREPRQRSRRPTIQWLLPQVAVVLLVDVGDTLSVR